MVNATRWYSVVNYHALHTHHIWHAVRAECREMCDCTIPLTTAIYGALCAALLRNHCSFTEFRVCRLFTHLNCVSARAHNHFTNNSSQLQFAPQIP